MNTLQSFYYYLSSVTSRFSTHRSTTIVHNNIIQIGIDVTISIALYVFDIGDDFHPRILFISSRAHTHETTKVLYHKKHTKNVPEN
jgi:hypothetical protein